ncbi:amidohydrolase [Thioclava sp. L04-15]|uniref:amidohydrolase n=1 Tax=Thioclava sp. L04-15 TaxID=1915318 RepID=UPI0009967152|nr:amidohydrolase [Thioclava sp. L04-15]TNE83958.1 MAG: amidohydrolase [Paracoccaceae bacterium]
MLGNADLVELTALRHALHRAPEVSGQEVETARRIATELSALNPSELITGIGGHGVAAVFDSGEPGPAVLFRAELDALPIAEDPHVEWVSERPGVSHVCGHDGHMVMLMGLARLIARKPVAKGRVIVLFQPAEETGAGARAVIEDPNFARIAPDFAFAIHGLPGLPRGYVGTKRGLMNCASVGLKITLSGKTAHAADPGAGRSPLPVFARLAPVLEALGPGGDLDDAFRLVTLTHLSVGEPTFGIAPGEGVLYATLRTGGDDSLAALEAEIRARVAEEAKTAGLGLEIEEHDRFAASVNAAEAVGIARQAMDSLGIANGEEGVPMRASEDFGLFGHGAKSAMMCLGVGLDAPALHNPDYDFPDDLIGTGAHLFERIARDLLG